MGEKDIVRVAAVQIAPDLDSQAGTLERVLAAMTEAAGKGAKLVGFSRDLRALVSLFLLCCPASR